MEKVTCIISVYNEEKTIENVLNAASNSGVFSEVIVINDGSTDNTAEKIKKLKSKLNFLDFHFNKNYGKGNAMATGIEKSTNKILVFIDSDLTGLKKNHFLQLIKPLIENKTDMVLGQPTINSFIDYTFNPLKPLTGERALLKEDILPIVDKIKNSKFGVETLINLYYNANNKTTDIVILYGLKHFIKFEKVNQFNAIKQYFFACHQIIITTFSNYNLITKIVKNKFNKINNSNL